MTLFTALEHLPQACAAAEEHGHVSQGPRVALCRYGSIALFLRDGACRGRKVRPLNSPHGRCLASSSNQQKPPVFKNINYFLFAELRRSRVPFPHFQLLTCGSLFVARGVFRTLVPRHANGDAHLDDQVTLKQTWKAVSGMSIDQRTVDRRLLHFTPVNPAVLVVYFSLASVAIEQGASLQNHEPNVRVW